MATEAALDLPHAEAFVELVALATEFHDMGKLDDDNQRVLAAPTGKPLPCEHVDAGVKTLFNLRSHTASFAGMLAYSHHRGLPDVPAQKARDSRAWRGDEDNRRFAVADVIARTNGAGLCTGCNSTRPSAGLAHVADELRSNLGQSKTGLRADRDFRISRLVCLEPGIRRFHRLYARRDKGPAGEIRSGANRLRLP